MMSILVMQLWLHVISWHSLFKNRKDGMGDMQGAVLMAAVLTGFIKRLLSAMNAAEIDIQVKTTSMV